MAKKSLIDTTVQLREEMLDMHGEPHGNAGQQVRIIEARVRGKFSAECEDGTMIVIDKDDIAPDATVTQNKIAYRHPSGDTWSGKGKQPAWVKAAIENGRHLSDFAVNCNELAASAGTVSAEVAQQLQTINLYTDPKQNVVQQLLLGAVRESPFNPRTNYPEDAMAEMAESAKVVGITQPVLVRPLGDGSNELVFGHRRYRAAKMAGLEFLPAIVRELTDAQSAQLQAVENSQRKDLDAIDEGRGFAAYIEAHGVSKDELCRQIGKSRTHVYNRLKLATLHEDGQKALRAKRIRAEVATLIARVPGTKHQAHALKLILDNTTSDKNAPEEALMTVRKARDMLREKFTLGLKDAIWAPEDATLVPSAGACTVCPKRSGVDPVIYVDLLGKEHQWSRTPNGENVCTDPECFDIKKTAQLKRDQAALEAKGKTVMVGGKARQTISAAGEIKNGYIAVKEVRDALKKATSSGKPAPTIITVQNPRDGKTVEVVKLDELATAGVKVADATPKSSQAKQAARQAERDAAEAKAEADTAFYEVLFTEVREAAAKVPRTTLDLQLVAARLYEYLDYDEQQLIAAAHGYANSQALQKQIGSMPADQLARLLLDYALTENIEQGSYYGNQPPKALLSAAKQYGINVAARRKAFDAEAKTKAPAPAKEKPSASVEQDEDDEVEA